MTGKAIYLGGAGIALSFGMLAFGYLAGRIEGDRAVDQPQVLALSGENLGRADVETIVREYLLANPELLVEVQAALDAKQKEAQRVAQLDAISESREEIFSSPRDGVFGNPDGKVTIVEFFDYNCGYCKRAMQDMQALTAADPDIRFVLKEFPILGPDSQRAHIVAQAFQHLLPEKYPEFHIKLLSSQGRATEASAMKAALELGADEGLMRKEMENQEIRATFERTYEVADKLSITGTPSYVIGNEVVFGALGQEVLAQKVAAAKAGL